MAGGGSNVAAGGHGWGNAGVVVSPVAGSEVAANCWGGRRAAGDRCGREQRRKRLLQRAKEVVAEGNGGGSGQRFSLLVHEPSTKQMGCVLKLPQN